jgi:hypothetical protein
LSSRPTYWASARGTSSMARYVITWSPWWREDILWREFFYQGLHAHLEAGSHTTAKTSRFVLGNPILVRSLHCWKSSLVSHESPHKYRPRTVARGTSRPCRSNEVGGLGKIRSRMGLRLKKIHKVGCISCSSRARIWRPASTGHGRGYLASGASHPGGYLGGALDKRTNRE